MKTNKYKRGNKFGGWRLLNRLGGGGNGDVWRATNEQKRIVALKLLKRDKLTAKRYRRFRDEVVAVRQNDDIKGILPVLDSFLPEDPLSETPWYAMPVATLLEEHLRDKDAIERIKSFVMLARTLDQLHV
jgi:serine/threonine-protein kinase